MENKIRAANPGLDYWDRLADSYADLEKLGPSLMMMNPGRRDVASPKASMSLMFAVYEFGQQIKNDASKEDKEKSDSNRSPGQYCW